MLQQKLPDDGLNMHVSLHMLVRGLKLTYSQIIVKGRPYSTIVDRRIKSNWFENPSQILHKILPFVII